MELGESIVAEERADRPCVGQWQQGESPDWLEYDCMYLTSDLIGAGGGGGISYGGGPCRGGGDVAEGEHCKRGTGRLAVCVAAGREPRVARLHVPHW